MSEARREEGYPAFVEEDFPADRTTLISFREMRGPSDERKPVHLADLLERRYTASRSSATA
jgi:hypothetical protein